MPSTSLMLLDPTSDLNNANESFVASSEHDTDSVGDITTPNEMSDNSNEKSVEQCFSSVEKLRAEHEEFKKKQEESSALIAQLQAENERLKSELAKKQETQHQQTFNQTATDTQSNVTISNVTLRKLTTEFTKLNKNPPPGISVKLVEDNLLEWEVLMHGTHQSPFAGGAFRLRLGFPNDYPTSPPKVWFFSEMFHPNVFAEDGRVCIDILRNAEKWKSQYGVETVLVAVQILLEEPNPLSPANVEAGDLYQTDLDEYNKRVKRIVQKSESYRKLSLEETKFNFNTIKKTNQLSCIVM